MADILMEIDIELNDGFVIKVAKTDDAAVYEVTVLISIVAGARTVPLNTFRVCTLHTRTGEIKYKGVENENNDISAFTSILSAESRTAVEAALRELAIEAVTCWVRVYPSALTAIRAMERVHTRVPASQDTQQERFSRVLVQPDLQTIEDAELGIEEASQSQADAKN